MVTRLSHFKRTPPGRAACQEEGTPAADYMGVLCQRAGTEEEGEVPHRVPPLSHERYNVEAPGGITQEPKLPA